MKFLTTLLTCLIALCNAVAIEINSPYAPNFFTIPGQPHWLPDSVSAAMTPGADSSFYVTVTTNRVTTPWILQSASDTQWSHSGESAFIGVPQWVDDQWSDVRAVLDFESQPFDMDDYPGCHLDVYGDELSGQRGDEWAAALAYYVNAEVVDDERGSFAASDSVTAYFTRTVSNIVTAVTNLAPHRFTTDLQSSVFHTLDGWLERDYFTSHTIAEPYHDLKAISLAPYGTNRTVNSRRITGKTNLWHVASALPGRNLMSEWVTGLGLDAYWSSTTFDHIYGPQMPGDISWTSAGLYSLSNRCAVLRGLADDGRAWRSWGIGGWAFTELFPQRFLFYDLNLRIVDTYDLPDLTPGHPFSFRELCETNDYQYCLVDSVTNRTRRLELETQAAINQAMSELDRTVVSDSATTVTGKSYSVNFRRLFTLTCSYPESGLVYDPTLYSYRADTDLYLRPPEYTNTVSASTNSWVITTPEEVSDAIEVGETDPRVTFESSYHAGHWSISGKEITDWLNEEHARAEPGKDCLVQVLHIQDDMDIIGITIGTGDTEEWHVRQYAFPRVPTNSHVVVTVDARNSCTVNMADVPDFSRLSLLPMNQAWDAGSHGRVKACKDVCTSSIGIFDHEEGDDPMQELMMHCSVLNRAYGDNMQTIHAAEWRRHRQKIEQDVEDRRASSITSPSNYVWFSASDVSDVLDSVTIPQGEYPLTWPETSGSLVFVRMNEQGVWSLSPDSPVSITVGANCSLQFDADTTVHTIEDKPALEEYVRTRITNVIDWNWNAIRKSTNE